MNSISRSNLLQRQEKLNLLHRMAPLVLESNANRYRAELNSESATLAKQYEIHRLQSVKSSISPGLVRNRVRSLSPSRNTYNENFISAADIERARLENVQRTVPRGVVRNTIRKLSPVLRKRKRNTRKGRKA